MEDKDSFSLSDSLEDETDIKTKYKNIKKTKAKNNFNKVLFFVIALSLMLTMLFLAYANVTSLESRDHNQIKYNISAPSFKPEFDPEFKPAILEILKFEEEVEKSNQINEVVICIENIKGNNYIHKMKIFKDNCGHDEENYFQVERLVKALFWIVGGNKLYISGSDLVSKKLLDDYSSTGKRFFDFKIFSDIFEEKIQIIPCKLSEIPKYNPGKVEMPFGLNGNRLGFDAGGSDRKVAAVINGETKFSSEAIWFPMTQTDPQYHFSRIMETISKAERYLPTVDGIGISTAGVVIDNKIRESSLFLNVPKKEEYKNQMKNIYLNVQNELEKKYKKKIPLVVANDGDVTALAGKINLKLKSGVLGISMGTSQAGGYINADNFTLGWINELAFVPIDYNKDAIIDEWSGDRGCGAKYFSEDGVIKLAEIAGYEDKNKNKFSPAEKLEKIQRIFESHLKTDRQMVTQIFLDIGTYLGYTIPYYSLFYDFNDVLILGRVTSGKGGNLIVERAKEVLKTDFPELAEKINIQTLDEESRRVGQAVAAASLPLID